MPLSRAHRQICGIGCVVLVGLLGSRQAAAQAQVSDEVKKAIAAAVQSSVADTIDKTVQAATVTSEPNATPAGEQVNTFWARPQFTEFFSSFKGVNTHIPAEIVPAGVILQLTPDLYAGLAANYAHVGSSFAANLYGGDGTATYIFYRSGPTNFRANLDFNIEQFDPNVGSSATSFNLTPSIDFETTAGRFVLTFSPGFALGWSTPSFNGQPSQTWLTTAKITYIDGGPWQPQFAVQYSQGLSPNPTSGSVNFTPELNYVAGRMTAGIGYQYTTSLAQPSFYSHTVLANFRYRF